VQCKEAFDKLVHTSLQALQANKAVQNCGATHFNLIAMSSVLPALLGAFVLQVHVLVGAAAGKVLTVLSLAACVLAALAAAEPSLSELGTEKQRFSCSTSCEQAQTLLHCLPALTARASMVILHSANGRKPGSTEAVGACSRAVATAVAAAAAVATVARSSNSSKDNQHDSSKDNQHDRECEMIVYSCNYCARHVSCQCIAQTTVPTIR
jgi:hypothetical protein